MPEAIVKYAVNSSLGTSEFLPLDVILKNQESFVQSDDVLLTFNPSKPEQTQTNATNIFNLGKFKPLIGGTVTLIGSVSGYASGYKTPSVSITINVYVDDVLSQSIKIFDQNTQSYERKIQQGIVLQAKKQYMFEIVAKAQGTSIKHNTTISGFSMLGTVKRTNIYNYIEGGE